MYTQEEQKKQPNLLATAVNLLTTPFFTPTGISGFQIKNTVDKIVLPEPSLPKITAPEIAPTKSIWEKVKEVGKFLITPVLPGLIPPDLPKVAPPPTPEVSKEVKQIKSFAQTQYTLLEDMARAEPEKAKAYKDLQKNWEKIIKTPETEGKFFKDLGKGLITHILTTSLEEKKYELSPFGFAKAIIESPIELGKTVIEYAEIMPFVRNIAIKEDIDLLKIGKKLENGQELSFEEHQKINAILKKRELEEKISTPGYLIGKGITQMPAWIVEYATLKKLTGGVETSVARATKAAVSKLTPSLLARKVAPAVASRTIQAAAMASLNVPGLVAGTVKYSTPDMSFAQTPEGEALKIQIDKAGDPLGKAITKSFGVNYLEFLSEMSGELVEIPATKFTKWLGNNILTKWFKGGVARGIFKTTAEATKHLKNIGGWNGILGELFEEMWVEPLIAGIEERKYYPPFFTPEGTKNFLITLGTIGLFGTFANIPSLGAYITAKREVPPPAPPITPAAPVFRTEPTGKYYHGSANPEELIAKGFDVGKAGSNSGYKGVFGEGLYITNDLGRAKLYGTPMNINLSGANLWKIDANNALDELYSSKTNYGDPTLISRMVTDKGYDGVQIINKEKGMEEIVIMNKDMANKAIGAKNGVIKTIQKITKKELDVRAKELFIKRNGQEAYDEGVKQGAFGLEKIEQWGREYNDEFVKKYPKLKDTSIIVYHDAVRGEDLAVINAGTGQVIEVYDKELLTTEQAFRTAQKPTETISTQQASKMVRKYFTRDEVGVEFVKQIQTPSGEQALGKYFDQMISFLKTPDKVTVGHEVVEAYLDLFTPEKQKTEVLKEVMEKFELKTMDQAREKLSDGFQDYVRGEDMKQKGWGQSIKDFFKNLWEKIKALVNKQDKVRALYNDIVKIKRPAGMPARAPEGGLATQVFKVRPETSYIPPEDLIKKTVKYEGGWKTILEQKSTGKEIANVGNSPEAAKQWLKEGYGDKTIGPAKYEGQPSPGTIEPQAPITKLDQYAYKGKLARPQEEVKLTPEAEERARQKIEKDLLISGAEVIPKNVSVKTSIKRAVGNVPGEEIVTTEQRVIKERILAQNKGAKIAVKQYRAEQAFLEKLKRDITAGLNKPKGSQRSVIAFVKKLGEFNQTVMNEIKNELGIKKPISKMNLEELGDFVNKLKERLRFKFKRGYQPSVETKEKLNIKKSPKPELNEVDYEKNRQIYKGTRPSIKRDVVSVIKGTGRGAEKILTPISTRLENIDPSLKYAMRRFEYNAMSSIQKDKTAISPYLKKIKPGPFNKMTKDDFADLDLALKNGDSAKINEINKKYGIEKEFENIRKMLDDIYRRANEVGFDIGYQKDYWPRMIKDTEGFLEYFGKQEYWSILDEAIKRKETMLGRYLINEEKANLINTMIRGYQGGQITLSGTGAMKERVIDLVTPALNRFYYSSPASLVRYVDSVDDKIAARKFFGKGNKAEGFNNIEDSIGAYTVDLLAKGKITPRQELELRSILNARFNPKGTHGIVGTYKNLAYIDVMGSFLNAVTQLGDQAWSIYRGGWMRTIKADVRGILGKSKITKESLGIEASRIASEFSDSGKTAKTVDKVFTLTGLNKIDRLGKEALINSAVEKYQKLAKSSNIDFLKKIDDIFGKEADQVLIDLKSGEIKENVKFLAFNELLDFHPVALSEMPETYLKAGNGRIFYMLKSYTIKQFDIFRREAFREMKRGNWWKGIKNLLYLAFLLVLTNGTADEIKDILTNRKTKLSDRVIDQLATLAGFTSRYAVRRISEVGAGSALLEQATPPTNFVDNISKDLMSLYKDFDKSADINQLKTVQDIPLIGKFYYWWFGKGAETTKKYGGVSTGGKVKYGGGVTYGEGKVKYGNKVKYGQ